MTPNAPKVRVPKLKIPKIAGLPKPASTALTETRLTPPDYILGLDMSLEHTGWCLYNVKTGVRQERVLEQSDQVQEGDPGPGHAPSGLAAGTGDQPGHVGRA